ncbi:hypothetical protein NQZ68_014980 [Dissostichus eleginoides]|nr:hypothetical protein NQZ68_014980 [Dissostichus eleginoides]
MADKQFLPVDALARQQLNSRALTAHSKFMRDVDAKMFQLMSSSGCTSRIRPDQHCKQYLYGLRWEQQGRQNCMDLTYHLPHDQAPVLLAAAQVPTLQRGGDWRSQL